MRTNAPMTLTKFVTGIGLALGMAPRAIGAETPHGETVMTCANIASGASWQISIDYDHSTVDSIPASISDAVISWHTGDGQNFKLDRKSGDLTVTLASSISLTSMATSSSSSTSRMDPCLRGRGFDVWKSTR